MRIASITAGAAGMFCGSCLRDNALAAALNALGHDCVLVPTYTPIRTDDPDVSVGRVFLGGINVYLDQQYPTFRRAPRWLRWLLDRPALLAAAASFSGVPDYGTLGELTLAMLRGSHGPQAAEIDTLADWLAAEAKPEIITLTNVLLSGVAPRLRERLGVPILASLQGDDIFLDGLPADYRAKAITQIRANGDSIAGYVSTSRDYADRMAPYLGLPRERIAVVPPGIDLRGFDAPRPERPAGRLRVGYFARIAPEKGLHLLADAYVRFRREPGAPPATLCVAGWLGKQHAAYFAAAKQTLADAGLASEWEHTDCPDHASKVRFLQSLDLFSVPAPYREPKGLYVLEALAAGVPVVQPAHGSFPEIIEATGGGVLVPPDDPAALANALRRLAADASLRQALGDAGRRAVRERYGSAAMAAASLAVYRATLEAAV